MSEILWDEKLYLPGRMTQVSGKYSISKPGAMVPDRNEKPLSPTLSNKTEFALASPSCIVYSLDLSGGQDVLEDFHFIKIPVKRRG